MRQITGIVSVFVLSLIGGVVRAQENPVLITILAPELAERTIEVKVNGSVLGNVVVTGDGTVTASWDGPSEGPVSLEMSGPLEVAYGRGFWQASATLNGSGHLEYAIDPSGTGQLAQWPAVTFRTSGGALDVFVDGTPLGRTELRRGVRPRQEHTFEWRGPDQALVCSKVATLPANVVKRYECDPATRIVSEP